MLQSLDINAGPCLIRMHHFVQSMFFLTGMNYEDSFNLKNPSIFSNWNELLR